MIKNCQFNTEYNVNASKHLGISSCNNNKTSMIDIAHPKGFVSSSEVGVGAKSNGVLVAGIHMTGGSNIIGCRDNDSGGGSTGGGLVALKNSKTTHGKTLDISIGGTGGTGGSGGAAFTHEKDLGVNVGCTDNRKYDYNNKLLPKNNYRSTQEVC